MAMKFLCPVEQISIGCKITGAKGIAQAFGYVKHFYIKIADPLHFIFGIKQRVNLYYF